MKRSRSNTLSAVSAVLLTLSFTSPVSAGELVADNGAIGTIEASTPAVEVVDPQPSGPSRLPARASDVAASKPGSSTPAEFDIGIAAGRAVSLDIPSRQDGQPRAARVVATAGSAAAPSSAISSYAVAPNCVSFTVNRWTGAITVYNNCTYYVRVKVVISWGPDGTCWGISPGTSHTGYFLVIRVDRLEAC
jgi:hypothetical protein